jgi:uncharacterized repeat protein (TIGR01451 family)
VAGGGAGGSVSFAVRVVNPLPAGVTQIANTARIGDNGTNGADPTPADNSSADTTPISAAPDLRLVKRANTPATTPGSVIAYTLAYTNSGSIAATGVVITETVPLNTTFNAQASVPTVWSCADGSGPGTTCTTSIPGAVAGAGGSGQVTFGVTVDKTLPSGSGTLANTAVIADDGTNGADPTPTNNASSALTPFRPTAIALASFTASREGSSIIVRWVTTAELNTWGFDLYRSADGTRGSAVQVTSALIPGQGRGQGGASYSWTDTNIAEGITYTYWLQETEINGTHNEYGPATARFQPAGGTHGLFIPLATR